MLARFAIRSARFGSTSHVDGLLSSSSSCCARAITVPAFSDLKNRMFASAVPEEPAPITKDSPKQNTATSSSSTSTQSKPPLNTTNLNDLPVNFADISRAHVKIRDGIVRTPCTKSHFLSELIGANIYLKTEFRQFTGSFKERGARNAIIELLKNGSSDFKKKGVIAASAGNHALALAYHGQQLGVPVTVVMPTVAPLAKVDKCKSFGCRIIIKGAHIGEAKEFAETLVASEGLSYVNGYDDPPIVAGAGTIGIEIIEDVPNVDAVVVPVGGAGLIAGVSCAIKSLKLECMVYGVEPEFCASYISALKAGKPVAAAVTPTLADGLAVPVVGPHAFEVARHYVDECVTCSEKEVAVAILRLIENEKYVVEGGGASGLAALLPGGKLDRPELKGKNIVVPLCGGNIDTTTLGRVIDRGLAADNRLVRFVAVVSDRPGGIARFTKVLSEVGASIKDIYHERAWLQTNVDQVQIKCVVELQGKEHSKRLKKALEKEGYPLIYDNNKCELESLSPSYDV